MTTVQDMTATDAAIQNGTNGIHPATAPKVTRKTRSSAVVDVSDGSDATSNRSGARLREHFRNLKTEAEQRLRELLEEAQGLIDDFGLEPEPLRIAKTAPSDARAARERPALARPPAQNQNAPAPRADSGETKTIERSPRRSAEEITAAVAKVVEILKGAPEGLRAEDLRVKLGLAAKDMPRILQEGLKTNVLQANGQKRATKYFAA
jgi:hypothetical protein